MENFNKLGIVFNHSVSIHNDGSYGIPMGEAGFVRELAEYFHTIHIVGLVENVGWMQGDRGYSKTPLPDNVSVLKLASLPMNYDRKSLFAKIKYYLLSAGSCFKYVRRADLWYVFLPGHIGTVFCILCRLCKKKYAVYVRGVWEDYNWLLRRIIPHLIAKASFCIVTGLALKQKLEGIQKNILEVSPMTAFRLTRAEQKRDYAIKGPPRILFVGSVVKEKGVFDLIDSVQYLIENGQELDLVIIGPAPGDNLSRLEKCLEKKELARYVKYLGCIYDGNKIKQNYLSSDIFVFLSYSEGFPRVIYEAMVTGLPIVTTELAGLKGTLFDGINCLMVKKKDPVDVAQKIYLLITNDMLREKIGREAWKTIRGKVFFRNGDSHAKQVVYFVNSVITV